MFILQTEDGGEFFAGKTYRVNLETYPAYTSNRDIAKKYKYKKVAEKACKTLNDKIEYDNFKIIENKE